jgi:hypothetical protein
MNGIAFTASLILFIGGIVLFGYSFEAVGFEILVFSAGIPFHLTKRTDA